MLIPDGDASKLLFENTETITPATVSNIIIFSTDTRASREATASKQVPPRGILNRRF